MCRVGKCECGNVTSDYVKVGKTFLTGLGVNVLLLGPGVREGRDLRVREDLSEVKAEGTPAAAMRQSANKSCGANKAQRGALRTQDQTPSSHL